MSHRKLLTRTNDGFTRHFQRSCLDDNEPKNNFKITCLVTGHKTLKFSRTLNIFTRTLEQKESNLRLSIISMNIELHFRHHGKVTRQSISLHRESNNGNTNNIP